MLLIRWLRAKDIYCCFRELQLVPSTHIRMLRAVCNASSR